MIVLNFGLPSAVFFREIYSSRVTKSEHVAKRSLLVVDLVQE